MGETRAVNVLPAGSPTAADGEIVYSARNRVNDGDGRDTCGPDSAT